MKNPSKKLMNPKAGFLKRKKIQTPSQTKTEKKKKKEREESNRCNKN